MDLLCKALINPGDAILAEDPTFLGVLQTMRMYRANIQPIATDEFGAIPESVEEQIKAYKPKLMYIIPTFQNPSGKTLTLERRRKLAELANKYGVVLAEDDPYRDLRYAGEPLPAIKSFDTDGWVVYLGSFSKLISPGIRVGYAIANPTLMRKLVIGKQSVDVHTSTLSQAVVDGYLRRGLMQPHIVKICASYKQQLDLMLDLFKLFPGGRDPHQSPGRTVRMGRAARGHGRAGDAARGHAQGRGIRARHSLLHQRRPPQHAAPELLQRAAGQDTARHGAAGRSVRPSICKPDTALMFTAAC